MLSKSRLTTLCLLAFLTTTPVYAQLGKARQAQKRGEYTLAMQLAREALAKSRDDYKKQLHREEKGLASHDPNAFNFLTSDIADVARIHYWNGYYAEAATLWNEVLANLETKSETDWGIVANIARCYIAMGDYDKATELTDRLAEQFNGLSGPSTAKLYSEFVYWNVPAQLYLSANRVDKAEAYLDARKPLVGLGKQHYNADRHYILNEKISMYLNLGRYGEAEIIANQMYEMWAEARGEDDWLTLTIRAYLAHVYAMLGGTEKANRIVDQIETLIATSDKKLKGKRAGALVYLGLASFETGRMDKAEKYLAAIEEMTEDKDNVLGKRWYLMSAEYLSRIEDEKGNTQRAGILLETAYNKYMEDLGSLNATLTQDPLYAELMYFYGEHYLRTHETDKAVAALKKVVDNRVRRSLSARAEFLLAQVLASQGKTDEAYPAYKKAVESSLTFFLQSMYAFSEKERSELLSTIRSGIQSFNSFASQHADAFPAMAADLYDYQLVMKSLLLRSSIQVMDRIRKTNDPALIEAAAKWQDTRRYLADIYMLSDDERKRRNIDLVALETTLADQEKFLARNTTGFKDPASFRVTWQKIQSSLKPGDVAVEIIRVPPADASVKLHYVALVLDQAKPPVLVQLGEGDKLENRYFKYHRNAIMTHSEDEHSYEQFWQPLAENVKNAKRLYFAPDGVYNIINPATLYNTNTKQYLAQQTDVRLVTSTADLVDASPSAPAKEAWLFGAPAYTLAGTTPASDDHSVSLTTLRGLGTRFADRHIADLPGTSTEVEAIKKTLTAASVPVHLLTGTKATEQATRNITDCRILHLATHGEFVDEATDDHLTAAYNPELMEKNPLLYSAVLLAGAQNTLNGEAQSASANGVLTAYEVINLDLGRTELVTLSACETGLGKVVSGEGVYGLPRAFRLAGSRAVLMSLWQVSDEATSILMSAFYKNWLELHMTKHQALAAAQQQVKQKFSHPYFWGAFVLMDSQRE